MCRRRARRAARPKGGCAAPQARRETRQIVGTILLCFGALIGILIMLFAGTLAGFILALPLFVCGTICLTVRQRTGLWCAWAMYLMVELYLRFAAGVVAGNIFLTFSRLFRLNPMRLAMSWSVALALLTLVACTLRSYRTLTLRWERRSIALLTAGWLAQLGIRQALALWVRCIVNAGHGDLTGYTWKLALSGTLDSLNNLALVVLLVLTAALWRGWRQSRSKTK